MSTKWVCHDCEYVCDSVREAIIHTEETFGHWLYEHHRGFRGHPPTQSIHASDIEGSYVDLVPREEAERLTRQWRDRARAPKTAPPAAARDGMPF
jgi:hypothetical protein